MIGQPVALAPGKRQFYERRHWNRTMRILFVMTVIVCVIFTVCAIEVEQDGVDRKLIELVAFDLVQMVEAVSECLIDGVMPYVGEREFAENRADFVHAARVLSAEGDCCGTQRSVRTLLDAAERGAAISDSGLNGKGAEIAEAAHA